MRTPSFWNARRGGVTIRKTPFRPEQLEPRDLLAAVPILHSLPEAEHQIFLDFDGHLVEGTTWNTHFEAIHAPPFDVDGIQYQDGKPSLNQDEMNRITSIWERMAEDFRPFNVDVTTEDPSVADPDIFQVGGRAQRVLFTSKFDAGIGGTGERWFQQATQGIAADSWYFGHDTPVWIFSTHPLAGEIGTHEVGHALGLEHDGFYTEDDERVEYRGEHGSGETKWSPIMGQGNGLSQWSKGEYTNATNNENDIGVLAQILGRRPDDYPSITSLLSADHSAVNLEGIIETPGDKDIFSFTVTQPATRITITISPWHNGPNLDIGVSLSGLTSGLVIHRNDPTANPADRLASSIDVVFDPDTYYLIIDGVGKEATPDDPGYSDYGSLGYYNITGSRTSALTLPGDINDDGRLSADDIDALYAAIDAPATAGHAHVDLSGDGKVDQLDVNVLVREIFRTEFGDFDLDGNVDFVDFLTLANNYGSNHKGWADGDVTGNGDVGFSDFLLLAAYFSSDASGD